MFRDFNDRFRYPFMHLNLWNPYPFKHLKPEKGTLSGYLSFRAEPPYLAMIGRIPHPAA